MNRRIRMAGTLIFVTAAAMWLLPVAGPRIETEKVKAQSTRQLEKLNRAVMREYFFLQRLQNNPDVDIYLRIEQEAARLNQQRAGMSKSSVIANQWQEQGPWNFAGRMRGIAVHPTDPNIVIAGAATGGVWKTTNGGDTWSPLTDYLPLLPIGAVAIDISNPDKIFAGTGEPVYNEYGGMRVNASALYSRSAGLLRSDDGGRSWVTKKWAGTMGGVHRIALHPTSSDTLLVATLNDLWKTTNGGDNFSRIATGVITDVIYTPSRPSRVYYAYGYDQGGSSNGIYVSDAGGKSFSWRKLTTNFPAPDSCGRIAMAISPNDPDRVYAAVSRNRRIMPNADTDFLLLMVSSNGGETWERKINAIPTTFTQGQAYYDLALGVSPADKNQVILGGLDVWRSSNGGSSFGRISKGELATTDPKYVHVDIHHFAYLPGQTNTFYIGGDGGIAKTTDNGLTYTTKNTNLGTIQYYGCAYDPSNLATYLGGTQDNGTFGKFGTASQWSYLYGGDGGNVAVDPSKSTVRYVTTLNIDQTSGQWLRPVVRTGIGSPLRLLTGMGAGDNADRFTWVPIIYFHPADRTRLYTATQYLYVMKNPDGGGTPSWQILSGDLGGGGVITRAVVAPTNAERMYVANQAGRVWTTTNLSNRAPTWTQVSTGLPMGRWITDINVDWNDENTAYLSVSGYGGGHVYKTVNAGVNWTNISGNLPDLPANAIVQSRKDANTLFVGTDIGVYVSLDGGSTWAPFGTGLPNVVVYDMKILPNDVLLAGTFGRGMWTTSSILGLDPSQVATPDFQLGQNFPAGMPGRSTFIPFSVARRSALVMKLYDAQGRVLRTLAENTYEPGSHTLHLDLTGLPAGAYFYTLETPSSRATRKLLVVR
ncbi:MAG: T9SS type A sorting domain-containing protein [Ignavibacteriae bacterium]|nr:T9SS type A sorting domain-containing protein [Ignavibacteriota bacterium]